MKSLEVSVGQYSSAGAKRENQDFLDARLPESPLLITKGVCLALADGISSSQLSRTASEVAVNTFLQDYYCTSEALSVKTAGLRVLRAINSWLYSQTRGSEFRYEPERGYVCTFSALVLKAATAHVLHIGDARVCQVASDRLRSLTREHRARLEDGRELLDRALGVSEQIEIDYATVPLQEQAVFVSMTDGVHEKVSHATVTAALAEHGDDLDSAARSIAQSALANGSEDNLSVQIVRVDALPDAAERSRGVYGEVELPLPDVPRVGSNFDGYRVVRELQVNHRSHVFLAQDIESGTKVALKIPAMDLRSDPRSLERFFMEEWVAHRLCSVHLVKPFVANRPQRFAYNVMDFAEGRSLRQWMRDNPHPPLEVVRGLVEQMGRALQALHRKDMIHQDFRPENIVIDNAGMVKLLDYGSVYVAGVAEMQFLSDVTHPLGTAQYMAPECFLSEVPTGASDLYSLAAVTYELLSGRLPYGAKVAQARTRAAQRLLKYKSVVTEDREIPIWLDETLRRGLHWNPRWRYQELSEFLYDLRHPSRSFLRQGQRPWIERDPVAFWKSVSLCLLVVIVALLLLFRLP